MGINHQEASKRRWAATSPEERVRLGKLHSAAVKEYWASVLPEERKRRAAKAAQARWDKKKSNLIV